MLHLPNLLLFFLGLLAQKSTSWWFIYFLHAFPFADSVADYFWPSATTNHELQRSKFYQPFLHYSKKGNVFLGYLQYRYVLIGGLKVIVFWADL